MLFETSLNKILNAQPDVLAVGVVSLEGLVVETVVREGDKPDQDGEFSDVALLLGRLVETEAALGIGHPWSLRIVAEESVLLVRRFSERYALTLRGHPGLDLSRAAQAVRLVLPDLARDI